MTELPTARIDGPVAMREASAVLAVKEHRMRNASVGISVAILLLAHVSEIQARNPTVADTAFCQRYAVVMQKGLEVQRSGDAIAIRTFRQEVMRDPQADLLVRGLGVTQVTPPWVANIVDESKRHCIDEVLNNMRGYLPGDPEAERPMNTPENHVGTINRMPSR